MEIQRSFHLFTNYIKSEETRKSYTLYLNYFKNLYKLKDYDSMASMPVEQLQIMVEDYVMDLKKRVNPNSVSTYMYGIQAFFEANDKELKWKKIRKLYPGKIKRGSRKAWTTKQVQRMIEVTTELRSLTIIHLQSASGCRVGALPDLKLKHLTRLDDGCMAILFYEDSLEEYIGLIHNEAVKTLDNYLEKRKNDGEYMSNETPVLRMKYRLGIEKVIPMNTRSIQGVMTFVVNKAGVRGQKKGNRFEVALNHGFRKRWDTIVKSTNGINLILAEKMFAHRIKSIPLDTVYADPTIEKLHEEYHKAIPELIIDESFRLEEEIAYKNKLIDKQESEKDLLINKLQVQLDENIKTRQNVKKILSHLNLD